MDRHAGPIDCLYLDLNGIIHPCFHPEDGAAPASEEEVYVKILQYVDRLLAMVRPRKLLYLAVDGPAPRAKMNQQRARRFKSAQEAEQKRRLEEEVRRSWQEKGRAPPADKPAEMDSNVITPGTAFMANLGRWLRHWAYLKLNSSDPEAACLRVVVSDASVPGEARRGEALEAPRPQRRSRGAQIGPTARPPDRHWRRVSTRSSTSSARSGTPPATTRTSTTAFTVWTQT